jgi:hypothetical protein
LLRSGGYDRQAKAKRQRKNERAELLHGLTSSVDRVNPTRALADAYSFCTHLASFSFC